jgi:hypothetical protein
MPQCSLKGGSPERNTEMIKGEDSSSSMEGRSESSIISLLSELIGK